MQTREWMQAECEVRHIVPRFAIHGFHHHICITKAYHEDCDESKCEIHRKKCEKCHAVNWVDRFVSLLQYCLDTGVFNPRPAGRLWPSGEFCAAREGCFTKYNAWRILKLESLDHGCARVAHCVTDRWRNFSHYCRPLCQYDVSFTRSGHREALTAGPTAHGVHKQAKGEEHSSPLNK